MFASSRSWFTSLATWRRRPRPKRFCFQVRHNILFLSFQNFSQFFSFFRFKVEDEWHHMQVSKKESLNLRNSIVNFFFCSAKQKKSRQSYNRRDIFQSFKSSHLIKNFKSSNDWHQSRKFITDAKFYTSMHLVLLNEFRQSRTTHSGQQKSREHFRYLKIWLFSTTVHQLRSCKPRKKGGG